MPIIQKIDQKRFHQEHPIYKGSSIHPIHKKSNMPYKTLNNHQIYLKKEGEAFEFSSITDIVKTVGNVINDNKDTIGSVVSAVGNVSNAVKSISDTVKVSKELEKIKSIRNTNKTKQKPKDIELTAEQLEELKKLGNGFVKV